jgi:MoxR-like ATPase
MDRPFLVLASKPIEQEGTYQLSGSTGRSFYVENGWLPKMDEERMVVRQNLKGSYEVNKLFQ